MAVAKGLIILMVAGVDGVDNVVVVCRSESYLLSDIKSSARVLARDWEGPRSYRAPGFVAGQAGQGLLCHPTSRPAASTPSLRKSKMTLGQPRAHRIDEAAADQACLVRGREDDVVGPETGWRPTMRAIRCCCLPLPLPLPRPRSGAAVQDGAMGVTDMCRPCECEAIVPGPEPRVVRACKRVFKMQEQRAGREGSLLAVMAATSIGWTD